MEVTFKWLDTDSSCCAQGAEKHGQDWDNQSLKRQDVRESFCRRYISQELALLGTVAGDRHDGTVRSLYLLELLKETESRKTRLLPLTHVVVTETTIVGPEPQISNIHCKIDLNLSVKERKRLRTEINKKKAPILLLNSPYGLGNFHVMRTIEPFSKDGTFQLELHTNDTTKFDQTLILQKGAIVGYVFSGRENADEGQWTTEADDFRNVILYSSNLIAGFYHWEYREHRRLREDQKARRKAKTWKERKEWIETIDNKSFTNRALPGSLHLLGPSIPDGLVDWSSARLV